MKRIVGNTLMAFISVCIGLVLLELGMRFFSPQLTYSSVQAFTFPCFEQGEHRWIKLKAKQSCVLTFPSSPWYKKTVDTNSLGQRNPEVIMPKPADRYRVLFIGDSFTMGWGVEEKEAYPRLVEQLLQKENPIPPKTIETINAGFTGAGPSGYYLYQKYGAYDLDPDLIVIGFYMGNDITSRLDVEWVKTDPDGLPDVVRSKYSFIDVTGEMRFRQFPLKYQIPYASESHVFMFVMDRFFPHITPNASTSAVITPFLCLFKSWCRDMDQSKDEMHRLFLGMKRLSETKGKKLMVILIPVEFQAYPKKRQKYGVPIPLMPIERKRPNDEIVEFFEKNGIEYLDLLPIFLEHSEEETYFPYDDHWNPYGHEVAAKAISDAITRFISD